MHNLTKLSGSIVLASLLFSGCNSTTASTDEGKVTSPKTTSQLSAEEKNIVNESMNSTKRNLQRELVKISKQRSADSANLGSVIATFIEDDLSNNEGAHYSSDAARVFFENADMDVSELSDEEVTELMLYSYVGAISSSLGIEESVSVASKQRIFGIGTKFKELVKKGTDKVKDKIVDIVDDSKLVSGITNEVFKVMLKSGKMTNEMLRLAIKSKTIAEVMVAVLDDHWGLATQMQPLLENNVDFGHLFMDLAQAHDYMVADFLFGRIDGAMYYSMTKAMTLSREDIGNGSAGKMTRVLSELMALPRMAKFFNVPSTLEYTDGQSVEAFSKLLFSNGTSERGDGNEYANERFFYEMFATPESTANFVKAMNNIDEDIRLALMDQIFLGESKFAEPDEMQGYYNIYAIAGGMAYGLGVGAVNYDKYEQSLLGFAKLVPTSRFYNYGVSFSTAGYSYYRDDNQAYIENFKGLVYGTMFDINSDTYDYSTWLDFDKDGLEKETIIKRFYQFVLNREPDSEGEKALSDALDTLDQKTVADNFVKATEVEIGITSDDEFIRGLYVYGLKREPDTVGLTNWTTQLSNGMSRGDVLLAFINSEEAGGDSWWNEITNSYDKIDYSSWLETDDTIEDETVVDRFYKFLLNREADEEGKTAYLAELKTVDRAVVAKSFVENAKAEVGEQTNSEFVTSLYKNGFEREPDAEGLAYWVGELDAGTNTRGNVLLAFVNAAGGDSWYDDVSNYFGGSYEEAYSSLGSYFDTIKEDVLALFNGMSFDHFFKDSETKIEYFVSNSAEVKKVAVTYNNDEYTDTKLYNSAQTWAYIPNKWAQEDWIKESDSEYLDMNFSFSSGYVTGYVVSPLDLEAVKSALPVDLKSVELNGDELLSTDESAVYHIYSVKLASSTNLRLEWSSLSASTSAIFFNTDNAIANSELLEEKPTDVGVCAAVYAPVCASVKVECVTTPCEPVEQTFSNKCEMNKNALATFLRDGEC